MGYFSWPGHIAGAFIELAVENYRENLGITPNL